MLKKNVLCSLAVICILATVPSIKADPPLVSPDQDLSQFDQYFIKKTNWQPTQSASSSSPQAEGPQIEAFWIGATQWMTGHDNGLEAFGGSIAKGQDFFGSSLSPIQYIPVEIVFSSNTADWTLVQIFRRDNLYAAGGVGTFPGSAWDMSDSTSPRRLNLCIVEYDDGVGAPPNGTWDPDTSNWGNYEYLFVMNSDYDSTGLTYSSNNILYDDLDLLYTWLARLAPGRTFFETEPASLYIKTFIKLVATGFENDVLIQWVNPGPNPDHFKLFWGTSNPPTTEVTEVTGATAGFWHNGIANNHTYYYELRSYNSSDVELAVSTVVFATTTERSTQMGIVGFWNERSTYGDCWGYVDEGTGREYALICSRNEGMSIIDIDTVPNIEVGFFPSPNPGTDLKDVKVYENYAVVVSEGYATQIVDISDVTNPVAVSSIPGGRHNCLVDGDYVYLCGGAYGGLQIYSLANPLSPQYKGFYNPYYYHDYAIRNDTLIGCGIWEDGIDIIDVSDKTSPSLIGHFNYPNSGAHNAAFSSDGSHVFIGDEIGSGRWTRVFDISDPTNVSMVSQIVVHPSAITHNCYVRDSFLVIGHYTEGVRIWNVANPAAPFEVAHFDTFLPPVFGYNGTWSVYPYLPSGRILASDMSTGLYVLTSPFLPPPDPSCCVGIRGNMNTSVNDNPDILDLVYLINRIFRNGPAVVCLDEGDINTDGNSGNILDLNFLINMIFRSGPPPNSCP